MQLQVANAKQGITWAREGLSLLRRQPIGLGLSVLIYFAAMLALSAIPFIGQIAALLLVPASNAGFMATSRYASEGTVPLPQHLISPLRISSLTTQRLLVLGGIYTVCILLALGVTALVDGGQLFRVMTGMEVPDENAVRSLAESYATLLLGVTMLPLSIVFWYAPTLVAWEQQPVSKALFISLVALARNWKAFAVFALAWLVIITLLVQTVALIALLFSGNTGLARMVAMPVIFMLMTAVLACFYPIYRDTLLDKAQPEIIEAK
jgi:hypothetical protein